jgi:hypothetical protein
MDFPLQQFETIFLRYFDKMLQTHDLTHPIQPLFSVRWAHKPIDRQSGNHQSITAVQLWPNDWIGCNAVNATIGYNAGHYRVKKKKPKILKKTRNSDFDLFSKTLAPLYCFVIFQRTDSACIIPQGKEKIQLKLSCYNKGLQNDKRRDQKQNNRQKTDE